MLKAYVNANFSSQQSQVLILGFTHRGLAELLASELEPLECYEPDCDHREHGPAILDVKQSMRVFHGDR